MVIRDRERLRQLVRDYFNGALGAEAYRARRSELLDNIGAPIDESDVPRPRSACTRVVSSDPCPG